MRTAILSLLALLLLPAGAARSAPPPGYQVTLAVHGDSIELQHATWLPRLQPASLPRDPTAWQVQLRDSTGAVFWSAPVASPRQLSLSMPPGQSLPLILRIPVPARDARLQLRDTHGRVRFSMDMDGAFAARARQQHRTLLDQLAASTTPHDDSARTSLDVDGYIQRQRAMAEQRRAARRGVSTGCPSGQGHYIAELGDTAQPCRKLRRTRHETLPPAPRQQMREPADEALPMRDPEQRQMPPDPRSARMGPRPAAIDPQVPTVTFSGRVRSDSDSPPTSVHIWQRPLSGGRWIDHSVGSDGHFSLALDPQDAYLVYVEAQSHFGQYYPLPPLGWNTRHDFLLQRGVTLSGRVYEGSGTAPVADVIVWVLDSANRMVSSAITSSDGEYAVLMQAEATQRVELGRDDETWQPPEILSTGKAAMDKSLSIAARYPVTISVTAPDGDPVVAGKVGIWQGDHYVLGTVTSDEGTVELTLPAGDYQARVRPGMHGFDGSDWYNIHLPGQGLAEATFSIAAPTSLDTATTSLQIAIDDSMIAHLRIEADEWPGTNRADLLGRRFELLADGKVVAASYNYGAYAWVTHDGESVLQLGADLYVPAGGTWRLRMLTPGFPPRTSEPFVATDGAVVAEGLDATSEPWRWQGTLYGAEGAPLGHMPIAIYYPPVWFNFANEYTAADGSFDLPACAACVYAFLAPSDGESLKQVQHLDVQDASVQRDVHLTAPLDFHPQEPGDGTLQLLYGHAHDDRFDILFIGDGYTAADETFTDSNGNGVWDGVLYYDLDDNGAWNSGEPYAVYGNAAEPDDGFDPTTANEPFEDANGDGALNIGEAEIFFRNARDYLRALLAADYWRPHRRAFRAWTWLAYSEQAGTTIVDEDDEVLVARDTLLDATVNTERNLMSVDYGKASELAATALPAYDAIVVLINQPIPVGRANSFVLASAGLLAGSPNSLVPSHEFGHKVGLLPDEYEELGGVLEGGTPTEDLTRSLDPRLVPWRDLLADDFDASQPTPPVARGSGLFEGAVYTSGGVYRSTFNSRMRYNSPWFSRFQEQLMDRQMQRLLHNTGHLRLTPMTTCASEVDGPTAFRVQWDVRDLGIDKVQIRLHNNRGEIFGTFASPFGQTHTGAGVADGTWFVLRNADTGVVLDMLAADSGHDNCLRMPLPPGQPML